MTCTTLVCYEKLVSNVAASMSGLGSILILLFFVVFPEVRKSHINRSMFCVSLCDFLISFAWLMFNADLWGCQSCPVFMIAGRAFLYFTSTSYMVALSLTLLFPFHKIKSKNAFILDIFSHSYSISTSFLTWTGFFIYLTKSPGFDWCRTQPTNPYFLKSLLYFNVIPMFISVGLVQLSLWLVYFRNLKKSKILLDHLDQSVFERLAINRGIQDSAKEHVYQSGVFRREIFLAILYSFPLTVALTLVTADFLNGAMGLPANVGLRIAHYTFGSLWGFFNAVTFSVTVSVVSPRRLRDVLSNVHTFSFFRKYCERCHVTENLLFLLDFDRLVTKHSEFFRLERKSGFLHLHRRSSKLSILGLDQIFVANIVSNRQSNENLHGLASLQLDLANVVERYVKIGSEMELNLSSKTRDAALANPTPETVSQIFQEVIACVESEIYPKFVASPEYASMIDMMKREISVYGRNVLLELFARLCCKLRR